LSAGIYTVTVTDANNCVATTTGAVSQPAQSVQVQISQVQAACYGEANGIASATVSGGTGPYQYAWSNGQTGSNAGSFAAGLGSVTVTDAAGCTSSASFQMTELPRIQVNVSYIIPVCAGLPNGLAEVNQISGGLGMGNTGQYYYNWGVPGATDAPAILMLSGNASYTLTVTDFQGCTGTFTFFVGEPPAMTISATGKPASCANGTDGSAETGQIVNAIGQVSFQWSNGATSAAVQQLAPGYYGVTATDAKGCTADASVTVEAPPALQIALRPEGLTCHGNNDASLESIVSGGTPAYSYVWSNGATTENLKNIPAGTYSITVNDMNGCTIISERTIEELPAPQLKVTAVDPVCFGDKNGRFALSVQGGTSPWAFSINNGPFTPGGNFLALGAGTYQFNATDANGCTISGSGSLSQPPPLQVSLPADTTLTLGDSLFIQSIVTGATGLPAYTWSSLWNDDFVCTDSSLCDELLIHPTVNNQYTVTVTDENRCSASQSVRVSVFTPRGVYVPTGFSPNDDQVNDLLVVHGTGSQLEEIVIFSVYDRWGELVYEDRNFPVNETSRGWDGSFRGKPCNPGVFVWVLEALYRDGRKELLRGNVTLVR
jgi:gliding motility-associated-like protein